MPLDVTKYISKKKEKRTCRDYFRYKYLKHKRYCKEQYKKYDAEQKYQEQLKEKLKIENNTNDKEQDLFLETKFGKFIKVIWEIIYYGAIYLVGISIIYDSYTEIQVPQWLLATALLSTLWTHKGIKENYNTWLTMVDNDFYYSFTKAYKPLLLLPQLILLFVFAKYCSVGTFIILYVIILSYDLWDRRYITHNIKHDMILNELKKLNKYQ